MALSKEERDALPESQFAFPRTRQNPMHDEKHVKMAWDMVDTTKGVTDEERSEARKRILRRAKELGMDTSDWSKIRALSIEAMSLEMPEVKDHPNRMPFSGILLRLDQPSDKPPEGSGKRKIIVSKACAEKAIPSLLGMGVNFVPKLDGHDPQKKIGIITDAEVRKDNKGPFIHIEGFIYASDFPDTAARIRTDKRVLGFSFEAQDIESADPGADPLTVTGCGFTGAAIIRKDKAAYSTTALAANADGQIEEIDMTKEEIAALFAEGLKPINDRLTKIEASQAEAPKVMAKAHTEGMVEPHAKALESSADAMEGAGIGGHAERGHVHILRKMAGHMRAEAALGKIPHVWNDHSWMTAKGANTDEDAVKKIIADAVKPLQDALAAEQTKVKDLQAAAVKAAAAPERKTDSPEVTALIAKGEKPNAEGKFTVAQLDALFDAQKLGGVERIQAKLKLQAQGLIAA